MSGADRGVCFDEMTRKEKTWLSQSSNAKCVEYVSRHKYSTRMIPTSGTGMVLPSDALSVALHKSSCFAHFGGHDQPVDIHYYQ